MAKLWETEEVIQLIIERAAVLVAEAIGEHGAYNCAGAIYWLQNDLADRLREAEAKHDQQAEDCGGGAASVPPAGPAT